MESVAFVSESLTYALWMRHRPLITTDFRFPNFIKKMLFFSFYSLIHFGGEKKRNADRLLCKLIIILCANFLIKQVNFSRTWQPGSWSTW